MHSVIRRKVFNFTNPINPVGLNFIFKNSSINCLAIWNSHRNYCNNTNELSRKRIYTIGESADLTKIFTPDDVKMFSNISLDTNPIHTNVEYAKKTRFGKCIVHGVACLSLLSGILGTKLPGEGSIYLSQTIKFLKPAYVDEKITARVKLIAIDENNPRILSFETQCINENNDVLLDGIAKVLAPRITNSVEK